MLALDRPPLRERARSLLSRIRCQVAESETDREAIYRLRYAAYLRENAISRHASERVHDAYDESPNAILLAIHLDDRLAASIRLHLLRPHEFDGSPAMEAFPDILGPMLRLGRVILDPNRFVADLELSRTAPELAYAVLRVPFMAARHFDVDIATATVRREHQAFYRKVLRYGTACEPRAYPTLLKPLSLMIADFKDEEFEVLRRYPFFEARDADEATALFGARASRHPHLGMPMPADGLPVPDVVGGGLCLEAV